MVSSAIGSFVIGVSPIAGQGPAPPFPPPGPTTLQNFLNAYLYQEYSDDDDLQALVDSYNEIGQQYLDWFNQINLPVYTSPTVSGAILDWVGAGLYGLPRPTLPSGNNQFLGPLNTYAANVLAANAVRIIGPSTYYATTDDVYRRVLTWQYFKGDGKYFTIRWLKRRVMRFLFGANGVNYNVDQTYPVSVTFGVGNQANIRILPGMVTVLGGAIPGRCVPNTVTANEVLIEFTPFQPIPMAPIFKAGVDSGALELPFQFSWVVTV